MWATFSAYLHKKGGVVWTMTNKKKNKRILTLDDLAKFCFDHQFHTFSAKDSGYEIAVRVPATYEVVEDSDKDTEGLLKIRVKVCHTEKNRNGSYISEENMKKAMPSLKNRPVLGYIHQLDDGSYDFYGHNMAITEDEDGNEQVEYLERQIGSFTEDEPTLEYDKENDKTYVIANAVIPEEYTKAADIIREKNGSKNSCELAIREFQYNVDNKALELTDFYFSGSTLLGSDEEGNEIGEGMLGSRADIAEFSIENMSEFERQKGGLMKTKFEELMEKYGVTAEDVTFEHDGLSDEELEKKFEEVFGDNAEPEESIKENESEETEVEVETETEESEEAPEKSAEMSESADADEQLKETESEEIEAEEADAEAEVETEAEADESAESEAEEEISKEGSEGVDGGVSEDDEADAEESEEFAEEETKHKVTYELSLNDVMNALFELTEIYRNDNEYCFPMDAYDDYFIMQDWDSGKYYKQSYTKDNNTNTVALSGERVEVFAMFLTADEKDRLETNRKLLNEYQEKDVNAKKDAIFADESYAQYLNKKEFKELMENRDKYSVEELAEKADLAFAKCVKESGKFAAKKAEKKAKTTRQTFGNNASESEESNPYGSLFMNEE